MRVQLPRATLVQGGCHESIGKHFPGVDHDPDRGADRSDFLKSCIACGTATMLGTTLKAWGIGTFDGYPDGMGVLVDLTRCD